MKAKSQSFGAKKINFIEKNKKNVASKGTQANKGSSVPAVKNFESAIEEKLEIPKSSFPGFSFSLSFPDVDIGVRTCSIIDEHSLYPKGSYSDTDCPPTPPSYRLEEIEEKEEESIEKKDANEWKEVGTQTERKFNTKKIELSLRRSERLAKIKNLKRKSSGTTAKQLKFN